jgi:hypothetical protein
MKKRLARQWKLEMKQIPIVPRAKGAKSAVGLPPKKTTKGRE